MNNLFAGSAVIAVAMFYGWISTAYFGYNWNPESEAELVTDGITLIIAAIGVLIVYQGGS